MTSAFVITYGSVKPPSLSLKRQPLKVTGCDSKLVSSHQSAVGMPGLAAVFAMTSVMRRSGLLRTVRVAVEVAAPLALDALAVYWPALLAVTLESSKTGPFCP